MISIYCSFSSTSEAAGFACRVIKLIYQVEKIKCFDVLKSLSWIYDKYKSPMIISSE